MNEPYDIIQNVHLTEKSSILSEKGNQYVFRVQPTANKVQIRQAIEKLFKKKVIRVNTAQLLRQSQARTHRSIPVARAIGRRPSSLSRPATKSNSPKGDTPWDSKLSVRSHRPTASRFFPTSPRSPRRSPRRAWSNPSRKPAAATTHGRHHDASHRWRSQAEVSDHRFQAQDARRRRQCHRDRIRSEPHVPHRVARIPGQDEGLHPRSCRPRRR